MDIDCFLKDLSAQKRVIVGKELDEMILVTKQASFILDENEPFAVGVMLLYCFKVEDVLPKITNHSGKALAARCLVSLSLFKPALERLTIRYGAPKPDFYTQVGKTVFRQENLPHVAANFEKWNHFLQERFT